MNKNIWVFMETFTNKSKTVSLELLGKGRELADSRQEKLVAVVIGQEVESAANEAILYGADQVLTVSGADYENYSTDGYTYAMEQLVKSYNPLVVLIGATPNGRDLGGRLSTRLNVGLVAEAIDCYFAADSDEVQWIRPAFSGKLFSKIINKSRPQLATIGSNIFRGNQPDKSRTGDVIAEKIVTPATLIRTVLLNFTSVFAGADKVLTLDNAEIVVSAGRGIGDAEKLALIKDFADSIGAAMGVSKPLVDAGWVPSELQVGVTGKKVAAKLYIACGISGALQHTLGMKDSELIIAINNNPEAPIFKIAHYGIVGDLFKVIPVLKEEFAKLPRIV
ncbi:MAG: electron transfer flavoprotein subunit alpha [Firmicutes bacterium]|nr:electron transfer flavoprotein subunit alpha [Bacillota bacterium]